MRFGRIETWGFSIGRLWVVWHDLWDEKYGLWFEWDNDPSPDTIDRWESEAKRLTEAALERAMSKN